MRRKFTRQEIIIRKNIFKALRKEFRLWKMNKQIEEIRMNLFEGEEQLTAKKKFDECKEIMIGIYYSIQIIKNMKAR